MPWEADAMVQYTGELTHLHPVVLSCVMSFLDKSR